jgi:hypothetical protein
VPEETTLRRWATLLQPETLHRLLDPVVLLARSLQVPRGRQRRIEGTVVATHRPHPPDRTLRYDGVRVLGRPLAQARAVLQQPSGGAREALQGEVF